MIIDKATWRDDTAKRFDAQTNHDARISAALGYVFFLIPLIMHPESKFARYHTNQGLMLLLLLLIGTSVLAQIPYAGPVLVLLAMVFHLVFSIRGFVVALKCQAKHVPVIGKLVVFEFEDRYTLSM